MLQSSTTGQAPAGFVQAQRRHHPNAYRPWSTEDDELLARHAAQGTPLAELAQEFGRDTGAIRARLTRLGIDEPEPGRAPPGRPLRGAARPHPQHPPHHTHGQAP